MGTNNNHTNATPPILLSIAGFDPSCGAGTAADLKTFAAHGCYGVAAITALTACLTKPPGVLTTGRSLALDSSMSGRQCFIEDKIPDDKRLPPHRIMQGVRPGVTPIAIEIPS